MDPIKSATEMAKGIRVSSVLGSILYITPFTLAALVVVSFGGNTIIQTFLMWVVGALFILFILCYLGILFFGNHKELQSEEHTFLMKALEILGDQSHQFKDWEKAQAENNSQFPNPRDVSIPKPSDRKLLEKDHE